MQKGFYDYSLRQAYLKPFIKSCKGLRISLEYYLR